MKSLIGVIIGIIVVIGISFSILVYQGYFPEETFYSGGKDSVILKKNPQIMMHDAEDELSEEEKEAIKRVQSFEGNMGNGKTIAQVLGEVVSSQYPTEINDPNTKIGWSAFTDPDKPEIQGVVFTFESSKDEFSFLWYVDSRTGTIIPVGDGTEKLMDIING